jgi:HlyD family secretion protein
MGRKKKQKRWMILICMITILTIVGVVYMQLDTEAAPIDEKSLVSVLKEDIARSVVATGIIEPISNRIEIKSKASGIVRQLYVDVGDRVEPGQLLVELDRDQLLAQLRESEANLNSALADLSAAEADLSRCRILAEEYDVKLAEANHSRSIDLFDQKLISQSQFDETKGKLEEAKNRQRAAVASIAVAEATIKQREAQCAQIRAVIDRINEELKYTSIRSPIRGIVLSREVETGSAVSSILTMGAGASNVMILGDMTSVYVRGQVNESDIGLIGKDLPARITVETFKDKVFHGSVTKIAPLGKEKDNVTSFEVRVSVENPEGLLLANMSANAEIILEEHKNVLTIPEGALIYDDEDKTFVEIPDITSKNGKKRVEIVTAISTGTRTEVVSGLDEGDRIILQ